MNKIYILLICLLLPFIAFAGKKKKKEKAKLFKYVEQMPSADYDWMAFLGANMKYPENARLKAIEGRVVVKFIVDTTGKIDSVLVIKSVHPALDSEAVRVVASMPPWKPGSQKDRKVKVYFTLPLLFKLEDEVTDTTSNKTTR